LLAVHLFPLSEQVSVRSAPRLVFMSLKPRPSYLVFWDLRFSWL